VVAAVVAALLATVGVIGYRVLAPAETLNVADTPYPAGDVAVRARIGELVSAPLIVDERLRVFAEKRRVWADSTATAHNQTTPYWAYRRWPAQVVAVVAIEAPAGSDDHPIETLAM